MNTKRVSGSCAVCGGDIKKRFRIEYCAIGGKHHTNTPLSGYYCEDCGIYYEKLPNEKAIKKLRKKDDDIVRMSPRARKRFTKKLNEIEKSLKRRTN